MSPVGRAQVQDVVSGAHVGYCMSKSLTDSDKTDRQAPEP
jgi:hypothetical protein